MKRIKLTVLEKDMKTANFMSIWDCPIMRAAKRAGVTLDYGQIFNAHFAALGVPVWSENSVGTKVSMMMSNWKERKGFNKIFPFFVTPKTFSFDILVED